MIVDSAYNIQANLLIGNSQYTPNYIFVEYKNVQSTSETVSDEVQSTDTIAHYSRLANNTDYLLELKLLMVMRIYCLLELY